MSLNSTKSSSNFFQHFQRKNKIHSETESVQSNKSPKRNDKRKQKNIKLSWLLLLSLLFNLLLIGCIISVKVTLPAKIGQCGCPKKIMTYANYKESCVTNQCLSNTYLFCDTASKTCICNQTMYWNGVSCVSKKTYSQTCAVSSECYETQNLICLNEICDCTRVNGNENYWSGSICKAASSYGSSCNNSNECRYLTQGTRCVSGICSCYRVFGNESYWSGSACAAAKSLNSFCTTTTECMSLTEYSTCIAGTCVCPNGYYNSNLKSCVACDSSWLYYKYKCYTVVNCSGALLNSVCASLGGTGLNVSSIDVFNFINSISTIGFVSDSISSLICNTITGCYYVSNNCVDSHDCDHDHEGFCEYSI